MDSQSLFAIDPVNGVIKLTQSADRLANDEVAVKIEAVDRGTVPYLMPCTLIITLGIYVIGIPPLSSATVILMKVENSIQQKMGFSQNHSTAFVRENQAAGTFVAVMEVNIQSFVSYQVSDEGDGSKYMFAINPSTGVVTTTAILDFEKRREYSLVIKATSHSLPLSLATLTIFVTDDNGKNINLYPSIIKLH